MLILGHVLSGPSYSGFDCLHSELRSLSHEQLTTYKLVWKLSKAISQVDCGLLVTKAVNTLPDGECSRLDDPERSGFSIFSSDVVPDLS